MHFSALYTTATVKHVCPSGAGQVSWAVRTRRDGTIVERCTASEISYLFWEAV
jgi:hypothetical protein